METFVIAACCWAIGGFVNGVAGFGAALIAMPLVTQWVDLVYAVPSCTLISLSMNIQVGLTYRRNANWKVLRPLICGALPGAVTGATVLTHMPEVGIKIVMGVFLILYALWSLYYPVTLQRTVSSKWGYVAGFCSTAIGTAFGMGGPPTIIYAAMSGWSKNEVKAGLACFFGVAGTIMASVQVMYGLQNTTSLLYFVVCAPAIAVGVRVGIIASRKLGETSYRKVVYTLLLCMGVMILVKAILKLYS